MPLPTMQDDGPTQVFNILKANPPWLFGSEIVAHSRHAARTARQPYARPARILMAIAGIPASVGMSRIYTILETLEQQGHVTCQRLDESSYIGLLQARYGHGEQFAKHKLETEQFWAEQRAGASAGQVSYRYVHMAQNTGGPKRVHDRLDTRSDAGLRPHPGMV